MWLVSMWIWYTEKTTRYTEITLWRHVKQDEFFMKCSMKLCNANTCQCHNIVITTAENSFTIIMQLGIWNYDNRVWHLGFSYPRLNISQAHFITILLCYSLILINTVVSNDISLLDNVGSIPLHTTYIICNNLQKYDIKFLTLG